MREKIKGKTFEKKTMVLRDIFSFKNNETKNQRVSSRDKKMKEKIPGKSHTEFVLLESPSGLHRFILAFSCPFFRNTNNKKNTIS